MNEGTGDERKMYLREDRTMNPKSKFTKNFRPEANGDNYINQ